jgi:prolyl oligopeptidase
MMDQRFLAGIALALCLALVTVIGAAEDVQFTLVSGPVAVKPSEYPKGPMADVIDDYHGTKVPDPYRPLEDPDSEATRAWVEAENKITFAFLEGIAARAPLQARLTKLWDFEKFGVPFRDGGHYFFTRNSGLQNQSVLYTADTLEAEPRILLDPNTL